MSNLNDCQAGSSQSTSEKSHIDVSDIEVVNAEENVSSHNNVTMEESSSHVNPRLEKTRVVISLPGDVNHNSDATISTNGVGLSEVPTSSTSMELMPAELIDSASSTDAGCYPVNQSSSTTNEDEDHELPDSQRDTASEDMDFSDEEDLVSTSEESSDGDMDIDSDEMINSQRDVFNLPIGPANFVGINISHRLRERETRAPGKRRYSESVFEKDVCSCLSLTRRLELTHVLEEHTGCVNAIHWNQAGDLLASGSDDLQIVIWDALKSRKPKYKITPGHSLNIFQSKFMPHSNDSCIVSCARDGEVRLSVVGSSGDLVTSKKLVTHQGAAHKLALEMDTCHCFLSAGEDAVVYQHDLRQPKSIQLTMVRSARRKVPLHSIDKHPLDTNQFLVTGRDHFIRTYDKRKLADGDDSVPLQKFVPSAYQEEGEFTRDVTCGVYSYNGAEILGTYNDGDIFMFNSATSDEADEVQAYKGRRNSRTVKGVNFYGPRSEYIVSGSDCGNVYLWEKESAQIVLAQQGDIGGVVNVLEPHPYFPYLAISGLDNDVKIFMPCADGPVSLSPHRGKIRMNMKRMSARRAGDDVADMDMFWIFMREMRNAARRNRQAENGGEPPSEDESDDSDAEDGPRPACPMS